MLGRFQRALDFVHGIDSAGLVGVQHIDARCAGAAHFAVGIHRSVHGERLQRVRPEPFRQLSDIFAAGVVKVLARGKNLHCLRSGSFRKLKQSRMQSMIQEQVSRKDAQHLREPHGREKYVTETRHYLYSRILRRISREDSVVTDDAGRFSSWHTSDRAPTIYHQIGAAAFHAI